MNHTKHILIAILLTSLLCGSAVAAWTSTLIGHHETDLGCFSRNLLSGDIDNDGIEECFIMSALNGDNGEMIILELDGSYRTYNVNNFRTPFWTSLKDIDADGKNDVICSYKSGTEAVFSLNQFNSTNLEQTTSSIIGVSSDNPHGIAWMEIGGKWEFFTAFCGGGEIVRTELNYTHFSYSQIDTVVYSGEATLVFDIDNDGTDELIVAGGFSPGKAVIYIYEIDPATGAYTQKTTILDHSLDGTSHYTADITYGDIDNDGIENLIVLWSPFTWDNPVDGIIEAYEFNTSYASGYAEGFEISSSDTGWLPTSACRTHVTDVDGDGKNELLTGARAYGDNNITLLSYYDVATNGSNVTKHIIHDFEGHFEGIYQTVTPIMINDGGIMKIACIINNDTQLDFFLFAPDSSSGAYNITLLTGWNIIGWTDTTIRTADYLATSVGVNCMYVSGRTPEGAYTTYNPSTGHYEFDIMRGWGYYVMVSEDTLWERDL